MKMILYSLSFLAMVVSTYMISFYAPTERIMGDVQRIFYFHMGAVWVASLSFTIVFIASILFLLKKEKKWDILAYSSAEIGVIFITLTIIGGSIWAKPVWGTWWTWDPQLTTTFILWILYIVYLMLRSGAGDNQKMAKFSAVFAIVAYVDLPLVYISARVMRGISPVVFGSKGGGIEPRMMHTLLVVLVAFTLFFILLLRERVRQENLKQRYETLKGRNS